MRTVRIYEPSKLSLGLQTTLGADGAGHVERVLRMNVGDPLVLFNGDGQEYDCVITECSRKNVAVMINAIRPNNTESPLKIHLGQVMSRGDKMDFTIQKAIELGVTEITPLISIRCGVRLQADRLAKKQETYQKIVISACEQSRRAVIPKVNPIMDIKDFLAESTTATGLTLNPYANLRIRDLKATHHDFRLLIGPEGGFDAAETKLAADNNYLDVQLGPRILRTETAALVAISILQSTLGDL